MRRSIAIATIAAACLGAIGRAQPAPGTPEATIRALVLAIFSNDAAGYAKQCVPDPRIARLTTGGRRNDDALRELASDPGALQIKSKRPFLYRGQPARPGADGQYPVGTTAFYSVAFRSPMVVALVKQADGWKVDPRWWLAMTDMMSAQGPPPTDTPEFAARMLVLSLVNLDRTSAARFAAATPGSLDVLFADAPRSREPSGQLEALAQEMPLVRLRPGEFFPLPSARVIEGSAAADVAVLLGQYGSVEMPFVVRRVSGGWRVDPEPYFRLILQ